MKGKTTADLISAMSSGDTYVNVHTSKHPKGEIRGQIETLNTTGTSPSLNMTMDVGTQNSGTTSTQ